MTALPKAGAKSRPEQGGDNLYSAMFGYLYSMLASTMILGRPVVGGALFMTGQVTVLFSRLLIAGDYERLPKGMRTGGIVLGALSFTLSFLVLLVYPLAVDLPALWLVFALSCLVILMNELTLRMERAGQRRGHNRVRRAVRLSEVMLAFLAVTALILFVTVQTQVAWHLLGGFALLCLFQAIALYSVRGGQPGQNEPPKKSDPSQQYDQLVQVNAYKTFQAVMILTITALQVTMILIYTFIGASAQGLLATLGIAFLCTFLARWVTRLLLSRSPFHKRLEPATVLIIGLTLWLLSLASFALYSAARGLVFSYLSLAFCTAGVTMAVQALTWLEQDLRDIVRFATGRTPDQALNRIRGALSDYANLIGGMIALLGLAMLTLLSDGGLSRDGVSLTTQPLMLLPALALVVAAIPAAFRVPWDRRITAKVRTFLQLTENGETNLPMQKQLEDTVIKVHRRRYGIKLVILILRPLFYARVVGKETVRLDPDTSCVFTCNHGEIYGPVVTNLFIPFSFRPWVIDEIAQPDRDSTYLYNNTISRQKWIPKRLRWPATRLTIAFLKWVMASLNSIPVHRDNPREMIRTFRDTAEAMEAGDNILIFPENPNDESQAEAGYLRDGVGEFFTGFAMVAQLYHQRTGKCAQFYPIYADKKQHTLTFGTPTRYDPDNNQAQERERIAFHLRQEMLRMGGFLDATSETTTQPDQQAKQEATQKPGLSPDSKPGALPPQNPQAPQNQQASKNQEHPA